MEPWAMGKLKQTESFAYCGVKKKKKNKDYVIFPMNSILLQKWQTFYSNILFNLAFSKKLNNM